MKRIKNMSQTELGAHIQSHLQKEAKSSWRWKS
jgi:hypothetical protein